MLTTAAQEAWDRHYPTGEHDGAFIDGARWFAAGMAVCEFLADLAAQVSMCPECNGSGTLPVPVASPFGWPRRKVCGKCGCTGKRVTPQDDDDVPVCDNCGAAPGTSCNCHMGRFLP